MRRAMSRPSSVANVMIPMPPAWTNPRITSSPNVDQYVGVFTTSKPVTHTAETAVNTATTKPVDAPVSVVPGSISNTVPIAAAMANPATTAAAGLRSNPATGDHCCSAAITTRRRLAWGVPRSPHVGGEDTGRCEPAVPAEPSERGKRSAPAVVPGQTRGAARRGAAGVQQPGLLPHPDGTRRRHRRGEQGAGVPALPEQGGALHGGDRPFRGRVHGAAAPRGGRRRGC